MPAIVQVECLRIEKKTVVAQKQPVSPCVGTSTIEVKLEPLAVFMDSILIFLKLIFWTDWTFLV